MSLGSSPGIGSEEDRLANVTEDAALSASPDLSKQINAADDGPETPQASSKNRRPVESDALDVHRPSQEELAGPPLDISSLTLNDDVDSERPSARHASSSSISLQSATTIQPNAHHHLEDDASSVSASTTEDPFAPVIRDYAFPDSDPRYKGRAIPSSHAATGLMRASNLSGVFDDSSSSGGEDGGGALSASLSSLQGVGGTGWAAPSSGSSPAPLAWSDQPFSASLRNLVGGGTSYGNAGAAGADNDLLTDDEDDGLLFLNGATGSSSAVVDSEDESEGVEIPPGGALYVAAYEFVPEASQEMRLTEGEVVRVLER